MTTSVDLEPRAKLVNVQDDRLTVNLVDGRILSVPLAWFPRLQQATQEQQSEWELSGEGEGIHWESIDEDISVPLLLGLPTD